MSDTSGWHPTHTPTPIDLDDDPSLMCRDCIVCACCEPEAAATTCLKTRTGLSGGDDE